MLKLTSLFRTPGHKKFNFKTRYFDASREGRHNSASEKNLSEVDLIKQRMKQQFEKHRERKSFLKTSQGKFRIVLILCALAALALVILK